MRLVLLLVVFALAVSAELPTEVTNGYFEGRSGDLLLKQNVAKDESFLMFLNGKSSLPVPKQELALVETQVADLLSYLVGTAPLNPQADRSAFPKKGFFDNPKANLLFVFDSTTAAPEGLKHKIASEAYPDEAITALTSILTGATASKHGIVGDAWLQRESGETVSAFESWCPSRSGSRSASIQDIFGLAYGGRSLVMSFASKLPVARALSTKPFLLKPTTPNYGFFWSGKSFDSVYADRTNKYTASSAELLAVLAQLGSSPLSLAQGSNNLLVTVDGQQVALDLNAPEVVALVAEASYALHLVNQLSTDGELNALVSDEVPDFFSFGFTSIKDLQKKYGQGSSQLKAVSVLVDYVVSTVVEKLNNLYQGKLLAEAVFLGSTETTPKTQQILAKAQATLVSQLANEEHLEECYPELFLQKDLPSTQKEEACAFLQQVLQPADVEVYCLPDPSHFRSLRADVGNGTGDGKVADEIAIFQICLWSAVVLILGTIWAAAVMFTIDASKDTMLYNQHSQIHIKTIS